MANLYLTEQRSVLRKKGKRLIVEKDDAVLLDVQCHKIDAVLVFGNVQFTTQAAESLLENGIEMALLSRTGRLKGQLTSPATKNIGLRLAQFQKFNDLSFRLRLSRAIVAGKIRNSLNLVRRADYIHPDTDLEAEKASLQKKTGEPAAAGSIETLMGIEGAAAAAYFKGFAKMLRASAGFPGRRKRPPTDPVNAVLSLTYTMLFNEISSLLDGIGFDPYLGYFHDVHYGRASLAADLMEEFRAPMADRLTLTLFNNRVLGEADFFSNEQTGGCYLQKEAMKRYFA